jgi:predicted nuclease of predicted toxin-antitoxin system
MRFKVDENLAIEVAEVLRAAGHDATTVNDQGIGGAHDPEIASVLRHENRAILTLDVGFADIRLYPPREYPGIVVLRLPRQDKPFVLRVCERLVGPLAKEPLTGRLWIVEVDRIRVRSGEG